MKKTLLLISLLSFASAHGKLSVTYRVHDEWGQPVTNAIVETETPRDAYTLSWNGPIPQSRYRVSTDREGVAVCRFNCPQNMFYANVFASGYYHEKMGRFSFDRVFDSELNEWRGSSTKEISLLMRKIKNPTDLIRKRTVHDPLPSGENKFYFDLEKGEFVMPKRKGVTSDIEVSCNYFSEGTKTICTGAITFVTGGAYKMKNVDSSIFRTVYEADTNANYQASFPFRWMLDDNGAKGYEYDFPLSEGEYMVYRTRVVTNLEGVVTSAHYGVIHGPASVMQYLSFREILFNPKENDVNLEDSSLYRRYEAVMHCEEEQHKGFWKRIFN